MLSRILAATGAASLLFAGLSISRLLLALRTHCSPSLLAAPPQDAFHGAVVWITGASSGLGRELARRLCSTQPAVKLVLSSRRRGALEEAADECRRRAVAAGFAAPEVFVLPLDLADHASLPARAEEALGRFGRIDVLMNNGGVSTRSTARNSGFDVDRYVTDVDYLSYVALTKALIPSWEAGSGGGDGRPLVVNTSSVAGKVGVPVRTSYCGAKFALQGWFDSFRIEQSLAERPVDVLNVVLGSTRTDVSENALVGSTTQTFGSTDRNIAAGMDPGFVAGRVLAAANARLREVWIAPRKEMMVLHLNQYVPELAYRAIVRTSKHYAIEGKQKRSSESNDVGGKEEGKEL